MKAVIIQFSRLLIISINVSNESELHRSIEKKGNGKYDHAERCVTSTYVTSVLLFIMI